MKEIASLMNRNASCGNNKASLTDKKVSRAKHFGSRVIRLASSMIRFSISGAKNVSRMNKNASLAKERKERGQPGKFAFSRFRFRE